ncbi:MAG TPA: hypothetical protein VN721_11935 [Flavipsychrobacter sp.]|nr:hypothetical protein [Flavipsychrobacter sp.]
MRNKASYNTQNTPSINHSQASSGTHELRPLKSNSPRKQRIADPFALRSVWAKGVLSLVRFFGQAKK